MIKRTPVLAIVGLVSFGIVGAAVTFQTWSRTADRIAINERNYRLRALNEIVPPEAYDNALFDDTIDVRDPDLLGTTDPVTVYRARRNGAPVAAILTAIAPRGYSGAIHLMVGVNADGTLAGVRVTRHHETPGLGDNIEAAKSDWILGFDDRSLENPGLEKWGVGKDGGVFDELTGATITPRAVVKAVRNALIYFEANRELLFSENPEPGP